MNIITHLHNRVTSVVHPEDKSPAKALLLEDFYSIVLIPMSDKKEYNALTSDDKMSGQKLTLHKLFTIVSWNDDNPADTIINNLVMEHDLNKNLVLSLLKEATPLIFSEIKDLANGQRTPDYLHSLLTNPATSFVNYLPEWAFAVLPIATANEQLISKIGSAHSEKHRENYQPITISPEDAEYIKNKKALEKKELHNKELEKQELKKQEFEKQELEKQALEKQELEKQALEKQELEKQELEKQELEKQELEKQELEKQELEKQELEKQELEKQELEKQELEKQELEKQEIERQERERQERERQERERQERERQERERQERERQERERQERERQEKSKQTPPFLPPPVPVNSSAEGYENIVVDENDTTINNDNTSTIQKLMPIVGIILVGIIMWALLRGCQDNPDTTPMVENPPTATDTKSDAKTATSIQLSTDSSGKLQQVEVITKDDNSADKIEKVLKDNFNGFNKADDNIQVEKERKALIIDNNTLEKLLVLIKNEPDTSISIVGEEIKFINKDKEKRQQLTSEAQKILAEFNSNTDDKKIQELSVNGKIIKLPNDDIAVIKSSELNIDEEVKNSITASKKALHNLNGKPDIKAIEDALNTQIFNFAVNDNQIPKENKPILNKASELLKKTNVKIKIVGHTDSDGDEKYNKRLSEDRSYAVKKYLMIQGLPSSTITAEGAGESKPIDDNDTELGKFHNRRIEFEIQKIEAQAE